MTPVSRFPEPLKSHRTAHSLDACRDMLGSELMNHSLRLSLPLVALSAVLLMACGDDASGDPDENGVCPENTYRAEGRGPTCVELT